MWTIRELKTRAWNLLKQHYWKAFVVSLVIAISGGNGGFNVNWNSNRSEFESTAPDWWGAGSEYLTAIIIGLIVLVVVFLPDSDLF